MATNKPPTRKTHIVRICGTNKSGDRLDDMWVDVERMDVIKSTMQLPPDHQWAAVQRKLVWCDDPDQDNYQSDGTPSRTTEIVKICDPSSSNVDDPDEWIPVRVIKRLRSRGGGTDGNGNGYIDRFILGVTDQDLRTSRVIESRRIVHYDTNIDNDAKAAFSSDPTRREFVVSSDYYSKDSATKDDSQYVEHEIITALKHKGNTLAVMGEGRQTKLLNRYLIDESQPAELKIVGSKGFNPPYRLDPFQNIINVNFNALDQEWVLAIEDSSTTINLANHARLRSATGGAWTGYAATSGSGFTVIGGAVAYGNIKLKDGSTKRAFLASDTSMVNAKLGLIANGSITWSTVWTVPNANPDVGDLITSISYAKDRFFVTFFSGDGLQITNVVSTADGMTFSPRQAPFPDRGGGNSGPLGGSVAYLVTDREKGTGVYAMAGYQMEDDTETEFGLAFSAGFCWATSTNGISWVGGKKDGVFLSPGGGGFAGNANLTSQSYIAAGNGIFVAAASTRHEVTQIISVNNGDGTTSEVEAPYIIASCSVAISIDGRTWSDVPLPGAEWKQDLVNGDTSGITVAVRFIADKDYRDGKGHTGYFVAAGYESSSVGGENAKLWRSVDGHSWSLIRSENHAVLVPGDYWGLSAIDKNIGTVVTL